MIDLETLLKHRLEERVVEIPGVGALRIRSLSTEEVNRIPDYQDKPRVGEEFVLTTAVVEPALTVDAVRAWRKAAPHDEIMRVVSAILELSRLGDDAVKDAVHSFRAGPEEVPGVPPSPGAGHDGG